MTTADILFLAAEPREFAGFLGFCRNVQHVPLALRWSVEAEWKGRRVILAANGAGPVQAAQAARNATYRVLCNIGFCGALDPALSIGDIFATPPPQTTRPFTSGALASIDHVAQTAAEKARLRAQGFTAVDMEAAGLPQPFFAIKSVTDLANETFANDLNACLLPDGSFSTARLLVSAVQRPFARFPELLRLHARSKLASRNLGAFLDSCEF
jgi:nucleoside phosphorylase